MHHILVAKFKLAVEDASLLNGKLNLSAAQEARRCPVEQLLLGKEAFPEAVNRPWSVRGII